MKVELLFQDRIATLNFETLCQHLGTMSAELTNPEKVV